MATNFNIRIGNQTSFSAATPMAPFEFALAHGFAAFEWFPDKKENGAGFAISDLDLNQRTRIRTLARQHRLSLAVHAPWQASPRAPEGLPIFAEHIRFALEIGANLLNIHCDTDQDVPGFARALLPLITMTKEAGIKLAIENTVLTAPEEINSLFKWLQKHVPDDLAQVGLCFDMGHANLCGATRNDYIGYLDRLHGNIPIIHLHGHENFGDRDSHLPLFSGPAAHNETGIAALLLRMAARGFDGALIMEQWPEPPSLLTEARDRISRIIQTMICPKQSKAAPPSPGPAPTPPQKKSPESARPAPPLAEAIAAMDRQSRSWREKLLGVKGLLEKHDQAEPEEQLSYLAIYLRFLNTGEISCLEDGRHFRPSHHARTSQEIQEILLSKSTSQSLFLLRKILPWLPSFADDFMRHEPLTRIRDIAHRNDIPKELKKEIKESLQNKLHRCAGPEDLQTAGRILELITGPTANYSAAFVHEFQIFYGELQDFFNAGSLESRLAALAREQDAPQTARAIDQFLAAKRAKHKTSGHLLAIFEKNTLLRAALLPGAYRGNEPAAQNRRLAEIQLEDYGFVVLSELINGLEQEAASFFWPQALQALGLTLAQLRLSSIDPDECAACEAMLAAWAQNFDPEEHEALLLISSLLNRGQRLAEKYCEKMLALFADKAQTLGRLLAIPDHAQRMYAEGEIRGSLVFQLAKLTTLLQGKIRQLAKLPPWDIIVAGQARGRLTPLARLEDFRPRRGKNHILLLAEATGSEEIPPQVTAIILCRPIPHLSHLAIRTRQENIVLVALLDSQSQPSLTGLYDQEVAISATSAGVNLGPDLGVTVKQKKSPPVLQPEMPQVALAFRKPVLALTEAQLADCGNKAFGAARLAELADSQKSFTTPPGLIIPFGVAAQAIAQNAELGERHQQLISRLAQADRNLDQIITGLNEIYPALPIDPAIRRKITEKLGAKSRLMVRSSANCEDLGTMSGAGLYDSIANVKPSAIDDALRRVWASLWSRRAIISRERAGIPHHAAQMAVLIQEMISPDYAFVLHTANPINNSGEELYLELAIGLGETLASAAQPGSPLRLICAKKSGTTKILSFADFSRAARPGPGPGLLWVTVDYSRDRLTCDRNSRQKTAARLCAIGVQLEKAFGPPQDIEGVIKGDEIYLVQSRAQMIKNRGT